MKPLVVVVSFFLFLTSPSAAKAAPNGWGPVIEPNGWGPVIEPNGWGPVIEPNGWGPVIEPNGWGPVIDGWGRGAQFRSSRLVSL